jgi:hypothetical protein
MAIIPVAGWEIDSYHVSFATDIPSLPARHAVEVLQISTRREVSIAPYSGTRFIFICLKSLKFLY